MFETWQKTEKVREEREREREREREGRNLYIATFGDDIEEKERSI